MAEQGTNQGTSWKTLWAAFVSTLLILEGASRFYPVPSVQPLTHTLYEFQVNKMDRLPPGAVVLVGDSCLGNALDARVLTRELGRPVANLALTRVDSFDGDLAVLKLLLEKNKRPSLVVSMHAPGTLPLAVGRPFLDWLEKEKSQGRLTRVANQFFSTSSLVRQSEDLRTRMFAVERGLRILDPDAAPLDEGIAQRKAGLAQYDYLPQRDDHWDETRLRPLSHFELSEGHRAGMEQLYAYCLAQGIPLLFASGPSYEGAHTSKFVADYQRFLSQMKIERLYEDVPLYPREQFGDSINHLTSEARVEFTAFFAQQLRSATQSKGS